MPIFCFKLRSTSSIGSFVTKGHLKTEGSFCLVSCSGARSCRYVCDICVRMRVCLCVLCLCLYVCMQLSLGLSCCSCFCNQ